MALLPKYPIEYLITSGMYVPDLCLIPKFPVFNKCPPPFPTHARAFCGWYGIPVSGDETSGRRVG